MDINLGGLGKPLQEQMAGLGVDESNLNQLEKDRVSITRLSIRGYITKAQAKKAREKLAAALHNLLP